MNVIFSKQALKALTKMDATTKRRIKKGINAIPDGDIKKLKEYSSMYRLRVGDWRILFTIDGSTLTVANILTRGDAFK